MDYGLEISKIRLKLTEYISKNSIKSLIIGISGGIDSTLCAALARPVCRDLHIPLIGRSLPTATNKPDEIYRSNLVGKTFCDDFAEIYLDNYFTTVNKICIDNGKSQSDQKEKIRLGNLKARLRMMFLYDLAQKNDGMVLSTDNYTELMLGFWTLHGDVGDFGMIQNYWKTEVYKMSEWLATNEKIGQDVIQLCIDAIPTDGLGITNSDFEQFGVHTYKEVDDILQEYLDLCHLAQMSETVIGWLESRLADLEKHPVIQRHLKTEFKRNNPYNIPRTKTE